MRKLGAHVSTAGGVDQALRRAHDLGGTVAQVFSGSPRVWARTPLEKIDNEKVYSVMSELSMKPIITHSLYLVNVASDKPELLQKSVAALLHDLRFDALVKGGGVVVHLGSHQGRGWEAVKLQVRDTLKSLLAQAPAEAHLLIENSAGQNGKLNSELSEIRWLIDEVGSSQLGWCLDTCHAHAAGYALGQEQLTKTPLGSLNKSGLPVRMLAAEISTLKLWPELKCIHVNDSRDEFGSGRDRHENLGQGAIPVADFKAFLATPELVELPLIMEVPGLDGEGPDRANLDVLQAWVSA